MNFFEQQAAARRASNRLVLLFALAVVGLVLAVDAAVWFVVGPDPQALIFAAVATVAVVGLGSLYRMATLGGGGEAVALQLGGTPVPDDPQDLDLKRLRNVVEEVSIASGVPMPALFVLEHDAGINAFAAGYSTSDAVIAVTRGALDRLNRDELQGVVAHEFSHVLNGDMRLNLRLVGVLFGIAMISLIGSKVLRFGAFSGRGRGRGGGAGAPILVAAIAALVIGYIGLFFARMIRAGVSRSRERLADASAVQFTRQTAGLAGALKKIGGLPDGSHLGQRADAEEVSHMLFGEGLAFNGVFGRWLATHPPLVERIQALEPGFSSDRLESLSRQWLEAPPRGLEEDMHLGLHGVGALPAVAGDHVLTGPMVAEHVGHPDAGDYLSADTIMAALPAELRAIAVDRERVMPLLLGLLVDHRKDIAEQQVAAIGVRLGKDVAFEAAHLNRQHLAALHPMLRLPLANLCFPVLRRRPRPQLEAFLDAVNAAVLADGDVSLFEYCLGRLLTVQLRESLDPSRHVSFGRKRPYQVRDAIATLLAVVAHSGHADARQAQHAFIAGMRSVLPDEHMPYHPPRRGVLALEDAWMPLDSLDPIAKQMLVEAVTTSIGHDGRVNVAEAELLRTICGVLHCPLPPMPTSA